MHREVAVSRGAVHTAEGPAAVPRRGGAGPRCLLVPSAGHPQEEEWEVAASCKRAPPLTGWERVSVDVVHELLLAHARRYYYMYWPRGLPERPEELRHVAVFGVSMSGKTTFAKRMLGKLGRFYVIDITTHGEYTDLAPAVEGTILLSQFSLEELVKLYTIAMASVLGEEEKASSPLCNWAC